MEVGGAEANFMMVLSFALPVFFIVASRWIIPPLTRRFGGRAKMAYFIVAFVIIVVTWYLIDTRYGFHMGLW